MSQTFRPHRLAPAAVLFGATLVACSSTTPSYQPGYQPGRGPGATPTPVSTNPGVTPTPTHTSTATPTATPTPTSAPTGTISCTGPTDTLPGTYTSVFTFGNVSGSTYTQSAGGGTWDASAYTVGTPPPTPSPSPTGTTSPTPSPSPTATATPVTYVIYAGAYTVTGFSGNNGSPYTVNATSGCALLLTTQNGSPIGGGNYNATGEGVPTFDSSVPYINATEVANGAITAFTITNLGPSSGTGSFTLDTAATGTVTIQSSQVVTFDRVRRIYDHYRRQKAFFPRDPFRF